jgi:hypothetical protein
MSQPPNRLLASLLSGDEKEYYEAVGRLITSYAKAEAAAHLSVRKLSSLSDRHARIIFGGMRFSDIADRLRKLSAETQTKQVSADFDEIINQFNLIGLERDRIAHRSAEYDYELGLIITNELTAKSRERAEKHIFSLAQLKDMISDCNKIFFRFLLPLIPEYLERIEPGSKEKHRAFLMEMYEPWRYIPAGQQNEVRSARKARQRRKRQPLTSQG